MQNDATKRFVRDHTPGVVFAPRTQVALQHGINMIVDAIKPTLGPNPRTVVVQEPNRGKFPEVLDNAALIARRIIEIQDADADMGAMLIRQMLWQLRERSGDGTATAAVIFQTIFNEGLRYLTAGGNAQRLREYLVDGVSRVTNEIRHQARMLEDRDQIQQFACSLTKDPQLSGILAEIFDTLGTFGEINLRVGAADAYSREYLRGILWESGVFDSSMLLNPIEQRSTLNFAAIVATDFAFTNPNDLVPIIDLVAQHYSALVITAREVSENVIGLVNYVNQQPKPFQLILIKLPGDPTQQHQMLEDLELITGGQVLRETVGDTPNSLTMMNVGRVRRIWANRDYFCIEETEEANDQRRETKLLQLQEQYRRAEIEQKTSIRARIGRLAGASATLYVSGINDQQIRDRKDEVKHNIAVIRGALEHGVVPGGGSALLAAKHILRGNHYQCDEQEAAYRILRLALEAPTKNILENSGFSSGSVMQHNGCVPYMLDANGELVMGAAATVYDAMTVLVDAVESAVRTAALALTIDTLVHHRKPQFSANP